MTVVIFFLMSVSSCNFLRISPGVVAQGLGGCSVMSDEGLSAFHNPALTTSTKFNFALARWLYGTDFAALGASYMGSSLGIAYLDYGTIQGYDEAGLPTHQFSPYSVTVALGRKIGLLGLICKGFQERVDSMMVFGLCAGIASYVELGRVAAGAKIDNLGADLTQDTRVPVVATAGLKLKLSEDTEVILESKAPDLEMNAGMRYVYLDYCLMLGAKYFETPGFSFGDIGLSAGLLMSFQTYDIAYAFTYTQFSTSHSFSIIFTP